MKKTQFWIITVLLSVFSACSDKENTYLLSGKLDNCNECSVYLMEMQNSGVKALDTITADKKGNFKAKESFDEESIFIIQAKNDYIMLCPQKKEKIIFNGDYTDLAATYTVKGSEESLKLKILNNEQTNTRLALQTMSDQLKMASPEQFDTLRLQTAKLYKSLREQQRNFVINYINDNEGSLTTLVALYRNMESTPLIDPLKDNDIYQKVYNGLKKRYPQNRNTLNLEQFLNDITQMQQNSKADDNKK